MPSASGADHVVPGAVILVPEEGYLYGFGDLRMQVSGVSKDGPVNGWLDLVGVTVTPDGRDVGERFATVDLGKVRIISRPPATS